ncbi:GFA family protein [Dichotomicrobium thermohalophilum]|uniref:CENP-V/GFA domain-containing protein n=1 Tax=Dichotomicrobium thermohalophilum TaxID=933063 RepID=A0A397PHB2_9HYPH|nr:GFA family protein [Dichotomicrobium thermohalophilum]RIA47269.1 hypothetical protein BXY53_2651 [Dichotomicrobium thermohalophilum]
MSEQREGGCLCGSVRFRTAGPCRPVMVCHCRQCARWSGYLIAATAVPAESFEILDGADRLRWYRSSGTAERAFCTICGSSLFWRPKDNNYVAIMAGVFDQPSGLKLDCHVFVGNCADYEVIADALPQHEGYPVTYPEWS